MLSPFLKRLLFTRQFFMDDGKIEVLGTKQIMMPSNVVLAFQKKKEPSIYTSMKTTVARDFEDYAKKLGSGEEGLLKNIDYVFETFGLGKLEIVNLNYEKKECIVRIHNPPFSEKLDEGVDYWIGAAVISGMFSFVLKKEVDATQTSDISKGIPYFEFMIK